MTEAADLQQTVDALARQAEALAALQRRCAELRDARARPHAELDALAADIDGCIDGYLVIGEHAALGDPAGTWRGAVTELERQLRRLAVLRSQVLGLYGAEPDARCGS